MMPCAIILNKKQRKMNDFDNQRQSVASELRLEAFVVKGSSSSKERKRPRKFTVITYECTKISNVCMLNVEFE